MLFVIIEINKKKTEMIRDRNDMSYESKIERRKN